MHRNDNNAFAQIASRNDPSTLQRSQGTAGPGAMKKTKLENSRSEKRNNNMPPKNPTMHRVRSQTMRFEQQQRQQRQNNLYQHSNGYNYGHGSNVNQKRKTPNMHIKHQQYNITKSPIPKHCGLMQPGNPNNIKLKQCPLKYIECNEFNGNYLDQHYDEYQQKHLDFIMKHFNDKINKMEDIFTQKMDDIQEKNNDLRNQIKQLNKANDEILQVLMNVIERTQIDVDNTENTQNTQHSYSWSESDEEQDDDEGYYGAYLQNVMTMKGRKNGINNKAMLGCNSLLNQQRSF